MMEVVVVVVGARNGGSWVAGDFYHLIDENGGIERIGRRGVSHGRLTMVEGATIAWKKNLAVSVFIAV